MALPRSSLETYDYGGVSSEKNKASAATYPGGSSDSFLLRAVNGYHRRREAEMHHSLINFRSGYQNFGPATDGSVLSFGQNDCSVWNQINGGKYGSHHAPPPRTVEDSFETAAASPFVAQTRNCSSKEIVNHHGEWFYSEENVAVDAFPEARMAPDQTNSLKRPNMGDGSNQITKKQCSSGSSKKAKPKSSGSSKDPQSIAAKNRRERISERLKILQDLVPNGSKVDLVTMLEKAISYVKFLQLQVKVLATDEFWPAQGGKAADICEVKEAIEAILSSQRDRNSCSSTSK